MSTSAIVHWAKHDAHPHSLQAIKRTMQHTFDGNAAAMARIKDHNTPSQPAVTKLACLEMAGQLLEFQSQLLQVLCQQLKSYRVCQPEVCLH